MHLMLRLKGLSIVRTEKVHVTCVSKAHNEANISFCWFMVMK